MKETLDTMQYFKGRETQIYYTLQNQRLKIAFVDNDSNAHPYPMKPACLDTVTIGLKTLANNGSAMLPKGSENFQDWLQKNKWAAPNTLDSQMYIVTDNKARMHLKSLYNNLMELSIDVLSELTTNAPRTYVATVAASAVRDVQIDTLYDSDPRSDAWEDRTDVALYVGIITGTHDSVLQSASSYIGTDPQNIRLYPID